MQPFLQVSGGTCTSPQQEIAAFLALLKDHSEDALLEWRASLPDVARLARRLGAQALLPPLACHVAAHLCAPGSAAAESEQLRWLALAEEIQLPEVHAAAVQGLARRVLAADSPVAALLWVVRESRCGEEGKRALLRATNMNSQVIQAYVAEMKAALRASSSTSLLPPPPRAQSAPPPRVPLERGAALPAPELPIVQLPLLASPRNTERPPLHPHTRKALQQQQRRQPPPVPDEKERPSGQEPHAPQKEGERGAESEWTVVRDRSDGLAISWTLQRFPGLSGQVKSPAFELGEQQWRLVAFPRGRDGRGRHLSLYLAAQGSSAFTPFSCWQQGVHFMLAVANHSESLSRVRSEAHQFRPSASEYGFTTFMSLPALLDPSLGFLGPGGAVTLRALVRLEELDCPGG
eukprot:scaffold14.g1148.t1